MGALRNQTAFNIRGRAGRRKQKPRIFASRLHPAERLKTAEETSTASFAVTCAAS